VHRRDDSIAELTDAIVEYALWRVRLDPPPLDGPRSLAELRAAAGPTVTSGGIGGLAALKVFADVLAPACISVDHPRFLSFVPAAPTEAAILFDLVVGASSIYGGSWLEGGGAIYAENEALRWIADLAGLPATAGGVFVSGGTAGNLSALIAARWRWRQRAGGRMDRTRGLMVASGGAHSSVVAAARAMDVDVVVVPPDRVGRLTAEDLTTTLGALSTDARRRLFAIVATAGTTNAGVVDDLAATARACAELGTWMHVDGAYGGAALAAPSARHRFVGVEAADSFIVDPHKWLFAPFDSCALLYRDPDIGRRAHTQHAEYLDVLHADQGEGEGAGWNASDFAHHLSRRARGLPLWFSLATHGTAAYAEAIETTLRVAREGADLVRAAPHLELLVEPELSIVLFRRVGWDAARYQAWSDDQLSTEQSFVTPTAWQGETVLRWCVVNPLTTAEDLAAIVDSLGTFGG
jgi:glutamate/tyrosine decarboxylase-like PLP-dependent enzyme